MPVQTTKRISKCHAPDTTLSFDLGDLFATTPQIEYRYAHTRHFAFEEAILQSHRETIVANPHTFSHEHRVTQHSLQFLSRLETHLAFVIAATGHLPLVRMDCQGDTPVRGPPVPHPAVQDVNQLADSFRELMFAIVARNEQSEGRNPPTRFQDWSEGMVNALLNMNIPETLVDPRNQRDVGEGLVDSGSSTLHHINTSQMHPRTDDVDDDVVPTSLKFDLDRLLMSLRRSQQLLMIRPNHSAQSQGQGKANETKHETETQSATVSEGSTVCENGNASDHSRDISSKPNIGSSSAHGKMTTPAHKKLLTSSHSSNEPNNSEQEVTLSETKESSLANPGLLVKTTETDKTITRRTEITVPILNVEAEVATAEHIYTNLGGLHERTTFHLIRESNRIRGRPQDTMKFAGGLLGPYTSAHCEDLEVFKAAHLSYLYEPSLKPEEVESDALVMCLSYRHKDFDIRYFDKDRMTDLEYSNWLSFCTDMTKSGDTIYFWQDQKAKGVATDDDLDWIATGVLPYIVSPVVILQSQKGEQSDAQRLWMCVERHLGKANCGSYTMVTGKRSGVLMQKLIDITASERDLAARVLHGFFEGKDTYHEDDRLKMIRWAVATLVKLSPESLASFADISAEASISLSELKTLCLNVIQNTAEVDGSIVEIKKRHTRRYSTWEDLIPVIESEPGNVAGGISVRGEGSGHIWRTEYHIMGSEDIFYYVRYEIGNRRGCIISGKVKGVPGGEFIEGKVVCAKKLFSNELLLCFQRFAMRLAIFDDERKSAETTFFYLFQKHNLIKMIVKKTLETLSPTLSLCTECEYWMPLFFQGSNCPHFEAVLARSTPQPEELLNVRKGAGKILIDDVQSTLHKCVTWFRTREEVLLNKYGS